VGTEAEYGQDLVDYMTKAEQKCRGIMAAEQKLLPDNQGEIMEVGDDDDEDGLESTMQDVTDIVYEYANNCDWWKENFREGAIDSLEDKTVPTLV